MAAAAAAPVRLSLPLSLLREAVGHTVEVELESKDAYRGTLTAVDARMNATVARATRTHRDGRQTRVDEVFLKGSAVRLFVLPPVLAQGPLLRGVLERGAGSATAVGGVPATASGSATAPRKRDAADDDARKRQRTT